MNVQEKVMFLQQLREGFDQIGALFPTSSSAAKAMVADVARHQGPKTILEVGAGTGPITAELVKLLGPDDQLVVCEMNEKFMNHLIERFDREPSFANVRHQVEFCCKSVLEVDGQERFDYIVSTLPFTSLGADLVAQIFDHYQRLLKPGAVLTYIEYAYLRGLKTQLAGSAARAKAERTNMILDGNIERYQFRREVVPANLPPAWVRSLRFTEVPPDKALNIKPIANRKRLSLGRFGLSTESFGLLAGLGAAALLLKKKKSKAWVAPLALAGAAAWFHRDPEREVRANTAVAYSAADGRVLGVERLRHPRLGDQEWVRINVFLSLGDVHINRSPIAGKVVDKWDEPGGYSPAFRSEANNNESRYIVIEGADLRCAVAQRSGALARTIYTWCEKGELLCQGERYGMIRFGSRTDVYLPADRVEVLVSEGDRVVAGQTPLARLVGRASDEKKASE